MSSQDFPSLDSQISVLLVDDHPMLRSGVAEAINSQMDMRVVAEAGDGDEAISAWAAHRPDVTIMDLAMPGTCGVEALQAIRSRFPAARIVMLTTFGGDAQVRRALEAGAYGFLLKSSLRKELVQMIRTVHDGQRYISPAIAQQLANHMGASLLSEREVEVLQCAAAGNSNKRISSLLEISEETVKTHMRSILTKLDANDRTHAVTIALKRGIIGL
ncbi:response regulator transcription factor [Pseudoduganella violaceinigra]|uniref:response regulator transcription factor n=1 Tax=Pseudoduganella violaceinigra TaxID=246602 RepID=UPI001E64E9F7|nr:response regulator transcription factor [Pseudoduganella violaceinigra]